jgi:hypothetical protein
MTAAPDDQGIRYHYAITMARAGQIKESEALLVQAVGKASAHYNIGVILHEAGDVVGSEERFVAAILEDPRLEQAQHWLQEIRRDRQKTAAVAPREFSVTTLRPAPSGGATTPAGPPAVNPGHTTDVFVHPAAPPESNRRSSRRQAGLRRGK